MDPSAAKAPSAADTSETEIKKEMKKDPLSSKAPEKPMHEVSSGNALLSSETILRTNKRGERRRRRCQVAFSYLPQNDDELELKVGDIIEVVGEVEEGWWEGVLNGKTGMFPSNFIKELSGESDDLGISQDEQLSKSSLRETTGSESDGGDSSSTKSEGANGTVATAAIQPKKVKGVGFGDIFKDKPIKLRPRSIEVENDFLPVEKVCPTVSVLFQHSVEYPKVHCRASETSYASSGVSASSHASCLLSPL
uniref:SH3 domain-containing kinase-binding protein 1-like isoform X4 n=1 Tax=Halichoerus grypus TaxID=9711 RepID=UPI0016591B69|nr:SH3 domain-containing kinase-binding protein 1-like isoform X4 [Halichoerus grypus]